MITWMAVIAVTFAVPQEPDVAEKTPTAIQHFLENVQASNEIPKSARDFVVQAWAEREADKDPEQFISEALAVVSPAFRGGLEAFEAGQFRTCARRMSVLTFNPDPYLSTHAALIHCKALIEEFELEYADLVLDYLFYEDFDPSEYSMQGAELTFIRGYVQLHTFRSEAAVDSFELFLLRYPKASSALRELAKTMLEEARKRPPKSFGTAIKMMSGAGAWMSNGDAGREPQLNQIKALAILDDLIAQAESQEQQQQQQQNSGGDPNQQSTAAPQSPANQSGAPGGDNGGGHLGSSPTASPAETWGQMRPQDRERILQALQESFPSRYRDLVEQYYEELGKQSD
jgi:hypothetical protein